MDMSDINSILGIDTTDPDQELVQELVREDDQFITDLIRLRKKRGMSQKEVADALGLTQSAIAKFESGDRDPRLSTIRRYAFAIRAMVRHTATPRSSHDEGDPREYGVNYNEEDPREYEVNYKVGADPFFFNPRDIEHTYVLLSTTISAYDGVHFERYGQERV